MPQAAKKSMRRNFWRAFGETSRHTSHNFANSVWLESAARIPAFVRSEIRCRTTGSFILDLVSSPCALRASSAGFWCSSSPARDVGVDNDRGEDLWITLLYFLKIIPRSPAGALTCILGAEGARQLAKQPSAARCFEFSPLGLPDHHCIKRDCAARASSIVPCSTAGRVAEFTRVTLRGVARSAFTAGARTKHDAPPAKSQCRICRDYANALAYCNAVAVCLTSHLKYLDPLRRVIFLFIDNPVNAAATQQTHLIELTRRALLPRRLSRAPRSAASAIRQFQIRATRQRHR